jgi:hypothetical protein
MPIRQRNDMVRTFARSLMDAYGLTDWAFKIESSSRHVGVCYPSEHLIAVDRDTIRITSLESLHDTILHEIAHALTPNDYDHGPAWRAMARKIGATPDPSMPLLPWNHLANDERDVAYFNRYCIIEDE